MAKVNVRNRNLNKFDKDGNRKKANWEYRFEGAAVDGKRKQISKAGFNTKKEALDAGNKALAEYNQSGQTFRASDVSVADYLNYWFDLYCQPNLKYNTQINYLKIINTHLIPAFGKYKLKSLTPSILQEYANSLKLNEYSKSHIKGITSTLSEALDYAVQPLQYLTSNPMRYVKLPKVERNRKEKIILKNDE